MVNDVDVTTAEAMQADGAVLLDVREDDEWAAGHAPGAQHMPLSTVAEDGPTLAGARVLTVCRSGGRSAKAAEALAAAGVEVSNVSGGVTAWAEAGLPVVTDGGAPGSVA